jgi:hypothetical protein
MITSPELIAKALSSQLFSHLKQFGAFDTLLKGPLGPAKPLKSQLILPSFELPVCSYAEIDRAFEIVIADLLRGS